AAERNPGGAAGVIRRETAAAVFVFEQREVRRELSSEIRLHPAVVDAVPQALKKSSHTAAVNLRGLSLSKGRVLGGSYVPPSFSRSLSTRPASRRQRAVCFCSAFVPARVML